MVRVKFVEQPLKPRTKQWKVQLFSGRRTLAFFFVQTICILRGNLVAVLASTYMGHYGRSTRLLGIFPAKAVEIAPHHGKPLRL